MSEKVIESKLHEIMEKANNLMNDIHHINFRVQRTRKNLKKCTEVCKDTNNYLSQKY